MAKKKKKCLLTCSERFYFIFFFDLVHEDARRAHVNAPWWAVRRTDERKEVSVSLRAAKGGCATRQSACDAPRAFI